MSSICLYFQVHQPRRLRRIRAFQHPRGFDYWDDTTNREIFERAADKCYIPANRLMLDLIEQSGGAFRIAFSLTGTFLEQAQRFRPDVVDSFVDLARTGHVEFLAETYHHSLAGLWDDGIEFEDQVHEHQRAMQRILGVTPTTFRNTELIFDNRIAKRAAAMGFDTILAEGTPKILGDRSPNRVYRAASAPGLRVLLKNYTLSDDIAFRFSARDWPGYPLRADTYARWLAESPGDVINLFMDYETFGEHQWPDTGIFEFLQHLPGHVLANEGLRFALPREAAHATEPEGEVDAPWAVSWADTERDVSAWLGTSMQQRLFNEIRDMAGAVRRAGDPEALRAWRLLQTSDHLYYASTKHAGDGDVHQYFSPYDSPYMAYINHMNAIQDLKDKLLQLAPRLSVPTGLRHVPPDPGAKEILAGVQH